MSELREIQVALQEYLLEKNNYIDDFIVGDPNLRQQRLEIYRSAYYLRLIEMLGEDYSATRTLLGVAEFERIAKQYFRERPSTFFTVRLIGEYWPHYLEQVAGNFERLNCVEMAEFERALNRVSLSKEAVALTMKDFAHLAPERWGDLSFNFQPSIQTLELKTTVPMIWDALSKQAALPVMAQESKAALWWVWGREHTFYFRRFLPWQATVVTCLKAQGTFGLACEIACDFMSETEAPLKVAQLLQLLVNENLIIQLT